MYCTLHLDAPFLTESDWSFCVEVEAILRISKKLVTFSQTEKSLIAAYAPALRKQVHNQLSAKNMEKIDLLEWQSQVNPSRTSVNVDETFSDAGRECRRRALLETERRFFGNTSDDLMDDHSVKAALKLTQREKAVMVLDKRTCLDKQILDNADEWHDAIRALRDFYVEFYVQGKKYDRKQNRPTNDATDEQASIDSSDNDLSESEPDDHADMLIVDAMVNLQNETPQDDLTEEDRVELDTAAATKEYDDIIYEYAQWKFPWREVYDKKEIEEMGCQPGEKLDTIDHLINVDVEKMMKAVQKLSTEKRKGKYDLLINMCKNSRCQLGALASQSFAERMNSVGNLLVTDKRTKLGKELLNKLVVLHMNRDFIHDNRRSKAGAVVNFAEDIMAEAVREATRVNVNEN